MTILSHLSFNMLSVRIMERKPTKYRHASLCAFILLTCVVACEREQDWVPVSGVTLDRTSQTLKTGESVSLSAMVSPVDASDKSISWSSSNPSIATVSDGHVSALAAGVTTISVTTGDGNYVDDCRITVIDKLGLLSFTALSDSCTVELLNRGNTPDLSYSMDGLNWKSWDCSAILFRDGETLYLKGNNPDGFSHGYDHYSTFKMNGVISAEGNIMSLLYGDDYHGRTSIPSAYCFYYLFSQCPNLVSAPELPATELTPHCYHSMFSECISLTVAPELPATTMAGYCYADMFLLCGALTAAPVLSATDLAPGCYYSMFYGCFSLKEAIELPAETLAPYCYYQMFSSTGLTEAPALPATILADYCYSKMFLFCGSLAEAPELPATTLASHCYSEMFKFWGSLAEAPELPATTLASYCYQDMFFHCGKLTAAPDLPATKLANNCYSYMFAYCGSLSEAPEIRATTLAFACCEGMFKETKLTAAPSLPATILADFCYSFMFQGCTELISTPVLPAENLTVGCYCAMFLGCSKLNWVKMLAVDMQSRGSLEQWLVGVSSTGTFIKNKDAKWELIGDSGIPEGWTVLYE